MFRTPRGTRTGAPPSLARFFRASLDASRIGRMWRGVAFYPKRGTANTCVDFVSRAPLNSSPPVCRFSARVLLRMSSAAQSRRSRCGWGQIEGAWRAVCVAHGRGLDSPRLRRRMMASRRHRPPPRHHPLPRWPSSASTSPRGTPYATSSPSPTFQRLQQHTQRCVPNTTKFLPCTHTIKRMPRAAAENFWGVGGNVFTTKSIYYDILTEGIIYFYLSK